MIFYYFVGLIILISEYILLVIEDVSVDTTNVFELLSYNKCFGVFKFISLYINNNNNNITKKKKKKFIKY